MSNKEALEDLRSKIIASMTPDATKENTRKRPATNISEGTANTVEKKAKIAELPKGPRSSAVPYIVASNLNNPISEQRNQGRYGSHRSQTNDRPPRSRYNNNERSFANSHAGFNNTYNSRRNYHERNERNESEYRMQRTRRNGDSYLNDVVPIDQRRRLAPTKWDITPKGFEKVPAERAKLSGLFPQPGQPQELDHYKLERIALHGGTKSRRTRILFDDSTSNNLTISRMGCTLIIDKNKETKEIDTSALTQFLKGLIKSFGNDYELKHISDQSDSCIIEFNSPECTTIVFASRSYINRETKMNGHEWKRPKEYVQQLDHPDRLCGPHIIGLEGLQDEESIKKILDEKDIKFNFCHPISRKDEDINIFTNCALVEVSEMDEAKLNSLVDITWFEPNFSELSQNSSSITFQTLPLLVKEEKRKPSKVVKLFNCVDPLDLKYVPFYEELEETLRDMLKEVDTIWIKKPNVNYRLNFDNIGEDIGNIYVKFVTIKASENAMKELPGKKINGRSILCCYFNEDDFNLIRNI